MLCRIKTFDWTDRDECGHLLCQYSFDSDWPLLFVTVWIFSIGELSFLNLSLMHSYDFKMALQNAKNWKHRWTSSIFSHVSQFGILNLKFQTEWISLTMHCGILNESLIALITVSSLYKVIWHKSSQDSSKMTPHCARLWPKLN